MGGAIDTLWPGSGEDTKKYVVKQSSDNLWSVANVVDPEIETADSTELVTEFSHHVSYNDLADFVDISIQVRAMVTSCSVRWGGSLFRIDTQLFSIQHANHYFVLCTHKLLQNSVLYFKC